MAWSTAADRYPPRKPALTQATLSQRGCPKYELRSLFPPLIVWLLAGLAGRSYVVLRDLFWLWGNATADSTSAALCRINRAGMTTLDRIEECTRRIRPGQVVRPICDDMLGQFADGILRLTKPRSSRRATMRTPMVGTVEETSQPVHSRSVAQHIRML